MQLAAVTIVEDISKRKYKHLKTITRFIEKVVHHKIKTVLNK
jgi:hypothetical protein